MVQGTFAQLFCHLQEAQLIAFWRDYEPTAEDRKSAADRALPYLFVDNTLPATVIRRVQGSTRLMDVNTQPLVLELFQPATSRGARPSKEAMETAFKWLLNAGSFVTGALHTSHRFPQYLADNSLYASVTVSGHYIT